MSVIRYFLFISTFVALVVGPSPQHASAASFDEVCALASTVNCWGFEDESQLHYTWQDNSACDQDPFLTNHPNGNESYSDGRLSLGNTTTKVNQAGECIYPKRDNTHAASGNSSLKFKYHVNTGSNPSGNFNPVWKRLGTPGNYTFAHFGPGGEIWVRFSMRQSQGLIDMDALSDSGKKVALKRMWIGGKGGSKINEVIVAETSAKVMAMYSNTGTEGYGIQDHIGCTSRDYKRLGYPEPPCRRMISEQWRTYQIHVIVADNEDFSNGVVELYLDDEPTPIIRVTDSDMSTPFKQPFLPYREDATWEDNNGYGQMTFSLFATSKSNNHPMPPGEAAMWIDDIVVSKVRVPALDGTTPIDSTPPAAPANLSTD